jgi:hypothetical protein
MCLGWRCVSSSREPVLQKQGLEFKPQYCQKKKEKRNMLLIKYILKQDKGFIVRKRSLSFILPFQPVLPHFLELPVASRYHYSYF